MMLCGLTKLRLTQARFKETNCAYMNEGVCVYKASLIKGLTYSSSRSAVYPSLALDSDRPSHCSSSVSL